MTILADGWEKLGTCSYMDVASWFPEENHDNPQAKQLCLGCPVAAECLFTGVTEGHEHGIWGSVGANQFRGLTRKWSGLINHHEDDRETAEAVFLDVCEQVLGDARNGTKHHLVANTNSVGVTHGRRSTFNRGCRCNACVTAVAYASADRSLNPYLEMWDELEAHAADCPLKHCEICEFYETETGPDLDQVPDLDRVQTPSTKVTA